MTWPYKHFVFEELCTKDGSRLLKLAPPDDNGYVGFGHRLDALRSAWGRPLSVTSCCRTKAHNKKVGGNPRSFHVLDFDISDKNLFPDGRKIHTFTLAADFAETSKQFRQLAYGMGFSVGLGGSFTHIDDRTQIFGMPQARFTY